MIRAFRHRRWVATWLGMSAVVLLVSLGTGYRASRLADAPQYAFTKYEIAVDVPATASDEVEAAIDAMYAEAGLPPDTRREWRRMFVLGLVDGAFPLIVGLAVAVWSIYRLCHGRNGRGSTGATGPPGDIDG